MSACSHYKDCDVTKNYRRSSRTTTKLRKKFMDRALSFQGVPYHKRYHEDPSSEHHGAKLFLDCCGLVRKSMRDLKEDFGFRLGGGNQCYQFDTLPVELKEEELKPGDLVFTQAVMYSEKAKQHTHHITHVEIWVGDGEKTLGARWAKGVVEIHESYKFTSKKYGPNKYHFRSIEPWLQGICKSHCAEHAWNPRSYVPVKHTKKSLANKAASEGRGDASGTPTPTPPSMTPSAAPAIGVR